MKYWFLLLIAGLVAIAGGVLALANPLAATLTANVLVGAMFILFGALTLFAAGWDHRFWTALLGALGVLIGIGILNNPLESVLTMTLVLAVLFLVEGATKLILSFSTRGTPYFWMLILSGLISLGLGGIILSNFPASAMSILGLLLAIELISTGVSMVALSLHARQGGKEMAVLA